MVEDKFKAFLRTFERPPDTEEQYDALFAYRHELRREKERWRRGQA